MDVESRTLAESQAAMCSVFANSKRVLILWSLAERERSVGEIASSIGASLQCTSQHLSMMREKGLLHSRREGQTIFYRVKEDDFAGRYRRLLRPMRNRK